MSELVEFALRHPILVSGSVIMLIATLVNEIRLQSQSAVAVATQRAVQLINQGAKVVDVRGAEQFSAGHIIDAVNLQADKLPGESALKKKRAVLVVCDNGANSARVVGGLRKAGFENAWSIDGGLTAWQRDNLPLVSDRSKA